MPGPIAEWRFRKHTIRLYKGPDASHRDYLVGYSHEDDGKITGTGFPLSWIVVALAAAALLLAGSVGLFVTALRRMVR